jgi:hypothetical protein
MANPGGEVSNLLDEPSKEITSRGLQNSLLHQTLSMNDIEKLL